MRLALSGGASWRGNEAGAGTRQGHLLGPNGLHWGLSIQAAFKNHLESCFSKS